MPRLLGVDIPPDKPTFISLQYLYGVGPRVRASCATRPASMPKPGPAICTKTKLRAWRRYWIRITRLKASCAGS